MKVVFGLGKVTIKKSYKPVVTLGIFDGLHRGHIKLLKETLRCTRYLGGKSVIVTFYPHPQSEPSLYSLEQRLKLFKKFNIDMCIVIKFTRSFAKMSARDFIENLLIKKIKPHCIIVGQNFRFGRFAEGSPALLKEFAKTYHFNLKIIPAVKSRNRLVSSTYIRSLVKKGQLQQAERLLSRAVTISGTVVKGKGQGRLLGFPTANIQPHHEVLPPSGVYIARAILNKKKLKGLCYIGTRPTLTKSKNKAPLKAPFIEMYMFGFNQNIYGKKFEIQLFKRIREDKKFGSLCLLTRQINKDILLAKNFFNHIKSLPT